MERETFDVGKYLVSLKGKDYLPVAGRIEWFRHVYGDGWTWKIEIMNLEHVLAGATFCLARCQILDDSGILRVEAYKREDAGHFADFIEKATTGALGRALLMLGFGTNAALDEIDELSSVSQRVVDAPIERKPNPPQVVVKSPEKKAGTGSGAKAFNKEIIRLLPDITSKEKMELYRKLTDTPETEPIDDALAQIIADKLATCQAIEDVYKRES